MLPPIPRPRPSTGGGSVFGSTWDPYIGFPPAGTPPDTSGPANSGPYVGAPGTVIYPGTAQDYIGDNSNPFAGFGTMLGGLLNVGVGVWDRIEGRNNPQPTVQPQQPVQAGMFGMNPMMLLLILGALIGGFVLLRKK